MAKESNIQRIQSFDQVEIVADNDSWGHGERSEIIGLSGVVFGVTLQSDELKCYVYIAELNNTYGIAEHNLISTGKKESTSKYASEFAKHYFSLWSYGLIFSRPEDHLRDYVQRIYEEDKSTYLHQSLSEFCSYAKKHMSEMVENNGFEIKTPQERILKAIEMYEEILCNKIT